MAYIISVWPVSKSWWSAEPLVTSLESDSSLTGATLMVQWYFFRNKALLVPLLIQLAIPFKSYLPVSCIFSASNLVSCMAWKNRAFIGLGCTECRSQEHLGNLSLPSALIILLSTRLFDWDSPGPSFPKQRTKGFPWKWGPGSVNTVNCL